MSKQCQCQQQYHFFCCWSLLTFILYSVNYYAARYEDLDRFILDKLPEMVTKLILDKLPFAFKVNVLLGYIPN